MLVDEARARIDRQFSNNDSHDVKAAAVLAASGVIAPVVISFRVDYGPTWPVPVVLSIVVATLAIATLLPRKYNPGPNLMEFYKDSGALPAAQAARQLFKDLVTARDHNHPRLRSKAWLSGASLWGFFALPVLSWICWWLWN